MDRYDICLEATGSPMEVREFVTSLWRRTQQGGFRVSQGNSTMIGDIDGEWEEETHHPIGGAKIEYDPCEAPCVARLSGYTYDYFPYFALQEESKLWPNLILQCRLFDVYDHSDGIYPGYFRLRDGKEEPLDCGSFHFRSANPKHTAIHHWQINVEAPVEMDVGLAIQERLQDEGIFLSTAPGKMPLDSRDTASGRYMGVSRRSVAEIIGWFEEQFGVLAKDAGSGAVTLDELRYLRDFDLGIWSCDLEREFRNGQPIFADHLRPFREILERDITLTQQEQAFVVVGLLRYGTHPREEWDICQQRLEMLIGEEVAGDLWKEHVDDKAPVDYKAITQRLADVRWADCLPMGFELEQVLRGYGEHPEVPDRDERFEIVEKAMRSPRWTTSWPLWEIEMPS
ncbi:MAG: hypothetical protein HQ567_31305 [Candidatus Nealsonbacteria bacterium]|nr:hypothetical protein [Candidatus Nealsonbacteria bacterium]